MTRAGLTAALAVFGTGEMSRHYLEALKLLDYPLDAVTVVGRSESKAAALARRYQASFCSLQSLATREPIGAAIVAVTQDALPEIAEQAANAGAARILIEKPGALWSSHLTSLAARLEAKGIAAAVAFNRRFFPSVEMARRMIEADGGVTSCFFEITEIEKLVLAERAAKGLSEAILQRWGLANSVHVIDLAFHLAGLPAALSAARAGSLPWHSAGSVFAGSGETRNGALFGYVGNWSGAGRWRIEVVTKARRIILCPLETVRQQMKDSFDVAQVELSFGNNAAKPGLVPMLEEFLGVKRSARLPGLGETASTLQCAERIFGYADR